MLQLNLLETERRKLEFKYSQLTRPTLIIIGTVIIIFLIYLFLQNRNTVLQRQIDSLDWTKEKANNYSYETNLKINQKKNDTNKENLTYISELKLTRPNALLILKVIHNNIPDSVWIENVTANTNSASITGGGFNSQDIFEFSNKLQKNKEIKKSEVISINDEKVQIKGHNTVSYLLKIQLNE